MTAVIIDFKTGKEMSLGFCNFCKNEIEKNNAFRSTNPRTKKEVCVCFACVKRLKEMCNAVPSEA